MFEITKYIGPHTCVYPKLLQDHSQLDSTFIAREVQNVVQSDHIISTAALHHIVKDKFGYNVHYKRIWEAKRKTIIKIFGDWDESYQVLPRWMNIVKRTNPGVGPQALPTLLKASAVRKDAYLTLIVQEYKPPLYIKDSSHTKGRHMSHFLSSCRNTSRH